MSENKQDCLTMTVPEAGKKYFDLQPGSAYAAASRGQIPTIRIGRLLRVPVALLDRMLLQADRKDDAE
jgi:hypothetical protein